MKDLKDIFNALEGAGLQPYRMSQVAPSFLTFQNPVVVDGSTGSTYISSFVPYKRGRADAVGEKLLEVDSVFAVDYIELQGFPKFDYPVRRACWLRIYVNQRLISELSLHRRQDGRLVFESDRFWLLLLGHTNINIVVEMENCPELLELEAIRLTVVGQRYHNYTIIEDDPNALKEPTK